MEETVASLIKNRPVQEEETRDATETKYKMDFLLYFSISYMSITVINCHVNCHENQTNLT